MGIIAIFLLRDPDIIYRIPYEAVVAVVSGVVLTLCISIAVFTFVKPKAWLYRVIAAAVSLFAGIIGYLNLYNETFRYDESTYTSSLYIRSDFPFNFIRDAGMYVPAFIVICTVYAAVIFGSALLVQYIYKRIKKKTASTP